MHHYKDNNKNKNTLENLNKSYKSVLLKIYTYLSIIFMWTEQIALHVRLKSNILNVLVASLVAISVM